jgi:hypothetical protein
MELVLDKDRTRFAVGRWGGRPGEGLEITGGFGKDVGAPREGAMDDLSAGLEDDDFFSVDEGEDGIGGGLDIFDEVAVDDEWITVEPGEMDHELGDRARRCWRYRQGRRKSERRCEEDAAKRAHASYQRRGYG